MMLDKTISVVAVLSLLVTQCVAEEPPQVVEKPQAPLLIRSYLPTSVPPVNVPREKTLQIMANLIRNAAESLAERGHADERIVLTLRLAADGLVQFSVSDNGLGIAPEHRGACAADFRPVRHLDESLPGRLSISRHSPGRPESRAISGQFVRGREPPSGALLPHGPYPGNSGGIAAQDRPGVSVHARFAQE